MGSFIEERMKPFEPQEGFLTTDEKGHLAIDGMDTVALAHEYGTPLYVFSEKRIRENYLGYLKAFTSNYPQTEIFYALKANPLLAICKILLNEGAGLEAGGPGELYIARLLGTSPEKIVFNGNNKSRQELRTAIDLGIIINIDSIYEMEAINEEAQKAGKKANISIRVSPDVPPGIEGTRPELWTGLRKSKFGVDIESGLAYKAYKRSLNMDSIEVLGIHTHIGSPVEETRPYGIAAERIMEFAALLKSKLDIELELINMGGGFNIPFRHKGDLPTAEEYAKVITSTIKNKIREYDLAEPKLLLEPGGAIVGDAAILLLKVGMVKETPGLAKWTAVDGGANVILRASQGWYHYQIVAANKMNFKPTEKVNIAGPLCYSGDVIARNRMLPALAEGDILAALEAGAYTFTYEFHGGGSHPLPAVILISNKGDEVIRRRETLSDIIGKDVLPMRLLGI